MVNLHSLKAPLDEKGIKLVAVSKTKSVKQILAIYDLGHRIYGENRVQELREKQPLLPDDIEWHMIGHLQTNKVKYIAPYVAMIHSVDTPKLLAEINKQAARFQRKIPVLLELKIAQEATKAGWDLSTLLDYLQVGDWRGLENVEIAGVMGMASFVSNEDQIRSEFRALKQAYDQIKAGFFQDEPTFREISMGMSGDYEIAISEGSTMVRIGSLIFGPRM